MTKLRARRPTWEVRLARRFTPRDDRASAGSVAFIVGAAVFLTGATFLFNFATQPPQGAIDGLEHAALQRRGELALEVLIDGAGYPLDWTTNASNIENVTRLGLLQQGSDVIIDGDKFDAIAKGRFSAPSSTNGLVDYSEAKEALGIEGYDFHIRAAPVFAASNNGLYGVDGMDDFRIAYVGDFSGATPSAASAAEAYILDSLPIDFVNTTRTSLGIRADVFADSSQDIKSLLVPLIGASQAQTVISQGSGTKYDFTRVGAANYSTQLAAEPSTLTAALALYNDDNGLGYTKNREIRAVIGPANFSGLSSVTMTWNEFVDTNFDSGAVDNGDYGWVEVSPDGGTTWYALTNDAASRSQDSTTLPQPPGVWKPRTVVISSANCAPCMGADEVYVGFHWVADNDNKDGWGWLVDDITGTPTSSTGLRYNFEAPEYDMVVIGSNVAQTAFTPAENKYAIRDFVNDYGGRLLVLGGETNTQWLEPLFSVGTKDGSPGVASPDATHPLLTVPNELEWWDYSTEDKVWDFGAGSTEDLFNMVVGTTQLEHILTLSRTGAFGDEANVDGVVMLTTFLPYQMSNGEAFKFLANAIVYGRYHHLYLELGPEVPTQSPVATATRTAIMDRLRDGSGDYVEIEFTIYVWAGDADITTTDAATYPGPPRGLSALPSAGQVDLTWTWPLTLGSTPITGYEIMRGTSTGGAKTSIGSVSYSTYSYSDSTVTNGVTYFYAVRALNAGGESALSSEASATPSTIPDVPQGLSATGGAGLNSLSWTAPASTGGSTITSYQIYSGPSAGSVTLLASIPGNMSYLDAAGLAMGDTRYYKVSAVNGNGESSQTSAQSATVSTPATPVLSATGGVGEVILSWTAVSGATSYDVYAGNTSGATTLLTSVASPSYTETGLASGVTRYYRVRAVDGATPGAQSSEQSATTFALGVPPALVVAASVNAGTLTLTIPESVDLGSGTFVSYEIYAGDSSGVRSFLASIASNGTTTLFDEAGLANAQTRYYTVAVVTTAGHGTNSTEASATTFTVPDAPTLVAAVQVGADVQITWGAPVDNGGSAVTSYRVYRDSVLINETALLTFTDAAVATGSHTYEVAAVNAAGEGAKAADTVLVI